jgi:hypothetical protein
MSIVFLLVDNIIVNLKLLLWYLKHRFCPENEIKKSSKSKKEKRKEEKRKKTIEIEKKKKKKPSTLYGTLKYYKWTLVW